MSSEPKEIELLIAFARAASKAQEVEALLKDTLLIIEVVDGPPGRSYKDTAEKIEGLTLGQLKQRYLDSKVGKHIDDPRFAQMWKDANQERIFLMHKFFQVFPLEALNGNVEATERLVRSDKLLNICRGMLNDALEMTLGQTKIPREKLQEFLAFTAEYRKKAESSE
jgi:hypothetical protein